jgi:hypothetical protein
MWDIISVSLLGGTRSRFTCKEQTNSLFQVLEELSDEMVFVKLSTCGNIFIKRCIDDWGSKPWIFGKLHLCLSTIA